MCLRRDIKTKGEQMLTTMKIRTVAAVVLGIAAPYAAATNGDQMLGLTAIQNGMAGAVVAAPQDAATILVNPAGMAELNIKDVRFDLGVGFLNPPRRVNGFDSDSKVYMMPAGAVNFRVNERLTLGMGLGGITSILKASPCRTPPIRYPRTRCSAGA